MTTEKPNVLFFLADDMGVDVLHFDNTNDTVSVHFPDVGSYRLPNLESLLANGMHFTRAWSQPICSPTRATLFTGMHPWRTGVGYAAINYEMPLTLPKTNHTVKTLADAMSEAGYQCAIYGKWHLGEEDGKNTPTDRGWHRHEGILGGGLARGPQPPNPEDYADCIKIDVRYCSWHKDIRDATTGANITLTPEQRTHRYATADQIYSARDWIKQNIGAPWWVTMSFMTPHDPFHIPPAGTYTVQFKNPEEPTEQEMFVAMVESLDYYIGEMLNDPSPEIQEQLKNTVIIFAGDNGTHDSLDEVTGDDKGSVHLGGAHVPMLIADGAALKTGTPFYLEESALGAETDTLVHIADLYQTIIDIGGASGPNDYTTDSISIIPILNPDSTESDPTYQEWEPRKYHLTQFFEPAAGHVKVGNHAAISNGSYMLSFHNDYYEFAELSFDPATDQTLENITNNFRHPAAIELWQVLTDASNKYHAKPNAYGAEFPPLPTTEPIIVEASGLSSESFNNKPQTSTLAKIGRYNKNKNAERLRGKIFFDLSSVDGPITKATLVLTAKTRHPKQALSVVVEPLVNGEHIYTDANVDPAKAVVMPIDANKQSFTQDVTSIVQDWMNGTTTNYGFRVRLGDDVPLNEDTPVLKFPNTPGYQTLQLEIDVTPGPEILGVGTDNQLWYRNTLESGWVNVPNSGAVIGITIMPDGKLLGIGMDNDLWYRNTMESSWIHAPSQGRVLDVTIMPNGKILGVGTDNQLWYREALLTSQWQQVPNSGSVISIDMMKDGKILGVGTDNQLWYRNTLESDWVNVPESGAVIGVTVMPDGKIVGVGTDNQLWYRNTLESDWVNVPESGAVIGLTYAETLNQEG